MSVRLLDLLPTQENAARRLIFSEILGLPVSLKMRTQRLQQRQQRAEFTQEGHQKEGHQKVHSEPTQQAEEVSNDSEGGAVEVDQ